MNQIVQLNKIGKRYRKQQVLQDIDLCFEKGKIYGIIGPNGAGKTTIFKIISGLVRQTSGELVYFGGNMEAHDARKRISFMIENPYLEIGMSAYQNMKMLALLYDAPKEKVLELLELVGLENVGKKKVKNFSLGMKQRLGIAMALLKDPEMIVLDEPMNGLDPRGIIDMRRILSDLCREKGITVVISSHILHELEILADVFYLIDKGKVLDVVYREEIEKDGDPLEKYYMEKIEE